jgi:translation initiation factor IF-1
VNTAAAAAADTAAVAAAVVVATKPFGFHGGVRLETEPRFSFGGCPVRSPANGCRTVHTFLQKSFAHQPMKEEHIEVEGRVTTVLPGTMFRVELDNKHLVLATICGKMRKRWVRLTIGDRVKMDMSPYDLNKARITWRLK